MPPPSPQVCTEVQEWMRYARTDLRAASFLLDTPPDAQLISAYHAQQGAEKALKGFLVRHGVAFPFTHSISLLRELVEHTRRMGKRVGRRGQTYRVRDFGALSGHWKNSEAGRCPNSSSVCDKCV